MSSHPAYFGIDDAGELIWLGTHAGVDAAEEAAHTQGLSLRFLVDYPTARMLLRRLQMFAALEALPGLCWFTHFEWDGKLYLLEELGSREEAAAMLNSCDHESVALLDQTQMRHWTAVLRKHIDPVLP
jgi:hypothetical protein